MKYIAYLCSTIICQGLWMSVFAASSPPLYVTNQTDNTVYRVDPETGQSFLVTTTAVGVPLAPTLEGIELASETLAYTVGYHQPYVYSVNLVTGASSRITQSQVGPPAGLTGIAIADSTTAYVVNANDQRVYVVDLALGTHTPVSPPIVPPANQLSDIVLQGNIGYVTDFFSPNIYVVDLSSGAFTTIATSLSPSLGFSGIALSDGTAFVSASPSSFVGNFVYAINLATGENQLIATLPPNIDITGLTLVDDTLAYTTGASDNNVYAIHLKSGGYSLVTPTPVQGHLGFNSGIGGIAIFIPVVIETQGLSGNLRTFANYLNTNAPQATINLFNSLTGSDLTNALEAAMPARLGFATFAAQNGYLASSQTVTDHLLQRRFSHPKSGNPQIAIANIPAEELLVDASEDESSLVSAREKRSLRKNCKSQQPCGSEGFFTGWLTGFGEYAHEKAQRQTPAFSASVGGAVLGLDYNCANDDVIGFGASYAYTHVDEAQGMGHANVNQGFLGVYSTLHAGQVYFDLGAWGGYYHTDNTRKIAFTGFNKTADSSTHGWQAAPHFEIGYDGYFSNVCRTQWFGVSPFLLADWVANWQHSFREHGASPLNMQQNGRFSSLLRAETGLRFHEIVTLDRGSLIFQEKGSYAYQKMFHTGAVTALLVGVPSSFTVTTLTGAQNLGVVEFSMLFKPFKRTLPYVELRYQGEFGSRYQSHQGMLEIGKDF